MSELEKAIAAAFAETGEALENFIAGNTQRSYKKHLTREDQNE